eukprot:1920283-Rhodomonas_salina.2
METAANLLAQDGNDEVDDDEVGEGHKDREQHSSSPRAANARSSRPLAHPRSADRTCLSACVRPCSELAERKASMPAAARSM